MFFSLSKIRSPLTFIILLSFLMTSCSGESSENQASTKVLEEDSPFNFISDFIQSSCLGENCRYQKIEDKSGIWPDVFFDTQTFRFSEPQGQKAYQLTKTDLENLYKWRNKNGIPWTAWAYGEDQSFESHEIFSIYAITSSYFINEEVFEKVIRFLANDQGMNNVDEVIDVLTYQAIFPENLELGNPEDLNFRLSSWFREHVAVSSYDIYTGISEAFAWYISSDYKPGTLPTEIESAMDLIKKVSVPDYPLDTESYEDQINRAAIIIKAGSFPTIEGPFYASNFDLMFLYLDQYVAELPFYRELIRILKVLSKNPENFSKIKSQFLTLINMEPRPGTGQYTDWAKEVFADLQVLEDAKDLSENTVLKTSRFGELQKVSLREFLKVEFETILRPLTTYVRKWSEFE